MFGQLFWGDTKLSISCFLKDINRLENSKKSSLDGSLCLRAACLSNFDDFPGVRFANLKIRWVTVSTIYQQPQQMLKRTGVIYQKPKEQPKATFIFPTERAPKTIPKGETRKSLLMFFCS